MDVKGILQRERERERDVFIVLKLIRKFDPQCLTRDNSKRVNFLKVPRRQTLKIWCLWRISNWTFLQNGGRTKNSQFLCPSKVRSLRSFHITYTMISGNKRERSAEGKAKQTTRSHNKATYFCCTCNGDMEKRNLVTAATLTKVFYPYSEINGHENASEADANNTVLLCSVFHTVHWFLHSSA